MKQARPERMTSAEKDAAVIAVLRAAEAPLSTADIARRINDVWCYPDLVPKTVPVSQSLARIGAIRDEHNRYRLSAAAGLQKPATPATRMLCRTTLVCRAPANGRWLARVLAGAGGQSL
ncbi:hypothetical protein [Paracidovorax avenae]|uniref:hypothetical protein n=1 Tax=Paracidovorax avenae TaxID=80867 RepID=UPI001AD7F072|nr:hypothetical protein [Paracidovorax avenae]